MVMQALVLEGMIPQNQEKWYLDLVLIGTICDSMVMNQINRELAYFGLIILQKTKRVGLLELMRVAGVQKIDSEAIGFQIGPRLNAGGRMESAEISLKLLMSKERAEVVMLAEELNRLNGERRTAQRAALEEILVDEKPVIVAAGNWHEGVLGIIAGRLVEKYRRPAFVLGETEGIYKGSGRSFGDFNLAEAIKAVNETLIGGGGHAAACGVKLKKEDLGRFTEAVNQYYQSLNLTEQEKYLEVTEDIKVNDMAELNKKSVDDISVKGKRVLCRCDFNVPLKEGKITDENRLVAALPTIKKLISDGGKVILCSHLGKPKGEPKPELSLAPVAKRLSELLGQPVLFAKDDNVVGENAKKAVSEMKDGDVVLLENTRYRAEETKNGEAFSKDLASLADVFVDDAFGTAHRAHCSNVGVTEFINGPAVVGYLMEKEIRFLGQAVENPVRPFVAILGGAKVSDKLAVIDNLLEKCNTLIIGGGMAFTFIKAQGYEIGKSLVDDEKLQYCKDMLAKAKEKGCEILLPVDAVCAASFPDPIDDKNLPVKTVDINAIPSDMLGLDIGTKTQELFANAVKNAKTVVWNGPMGVFENPVLAQGTIAVAKALAETDATTIIGGGDSAAAVNILGFGDKMTHISTGGGASLEFLEGKELPGVAAANNK